MEIELAVLNSQTKTELQPRVRKYRSDFDSVRRQFLHLQQNYMQQRDKETLMGAQLDELGSNNNNKLLDHHNMIMQQNIALEGAIKVGYETGVVAVGIEQDLGDQNTRAINTRGKVRSIDGLLGESDSIITRMLRREKCNKLILTGICVFLILGIIIILYVKFS